VGVEVSESDQGEESKHHKASQQEKLDEQGEVRDAAGPMAIIPASWQIAVKSSVLVVGVVLNHLLIREKVKAQAETKC
jgi:hypothetical protein